MEKNVGKVVQIIGPVLDIKFETDIFPTFLTPSRLCPTAKRSFARLQLSLATTL